MKHVDNPFAFPFVVSPGISGEPESAGMTLRDYFAAKAIAPLIDSLGAHAYETVATTAYKIADQMIREREVFNRNIINEEVEEAEKEAANA